MAAYSENQQDTGNISAGFPANPVAGLSRPDLVEIRDKNRTEVFYGCDQEWYADYWQRQAGCGPCTAATILYYLSRTRAEFQRLYTAESHDREDFTRFMDEIWHYVTPGHMGVNEASILTDGVRSYASTHGIRLAPVILKIPGIQTSARPSFQDMASFIRKGLESDCPVAFLNLSNGKLSNLDSWHWVTITSLMGPDDGDFLAVISDSGQLKQISLGLWYRTTVLGGSLAYFVAEPAAPPEPGQRPGSGPGNMAQPGRRP
jgi:hypothetical protein